MLRVLNSLACAVFVVSLFASGGVVAAETLPPVKPIITEIKVRHDSNNPLDPDEYIEISNPYTEPIDLNLYVLEYFNVTNPTTQQPTQKPIADGLLAPGSQLVLAKDTAQIEKSLQSPLSSLSDTGGRLRLVTVEGDVVDEVAWTNSSSLATAVGVSPAIVYQCNSSTALCTANRTQSISRQPDGQGAYVMDSPTWLLGTITPQSVALTAVPTEPEQPNQSTTPTQTTTSTTTCEGTIISELLPNPAGSDTGKEYIELFNPTDDVIPMKNCSLQVKGSSKTFAFTGELIQPKSFMVLTGQQTGLTLPNSAGGTVWLLTPTEEIQAIVYPPDVDEDATWSLVNTVWQQSYAPTPGTTNIALVLKPCPTGQYRDAETNKCLKEATATTAVATLTPCKPGQERNPDTNRCRTVVVASSLLVPCKPGQVRNPETNRCRAVTAASALAPCPVGQERNPDTNRCRKIVGSDGATLAAVKDVATTQNIASSPKWWLAIGAATLAVGYGAYEWRGDIRTALSSAIARFKR